MDQEQAERLTPYQKESLAILARLANAVEALFIELRRNTK